MAFCSTRMRCISILVSFLFLSVFSLQAQTTDTLFTTIDICSGEEIQGFSESGTYYIPGVDANGNLQVTALTLNVLPIIEGYELITLCEETVSRGYSPGVYVDTLTTLTGCDSIRTLEVRNVQIYVPNVFSPNGDGQNDAFGIYSSSTQELIISKIRLIDRYGDVMVDLSNIPFGGSFIPLWDGSFKTKAANQGVYAYYVEFLNPSTQSSCSLSGDVLLMR